MPMLNQVCRLGQSCASRTTLNQEGLEELLLSALAAVGAASASVAVAIAIINIEIVILNSEAVTC